MFVVLTKDVKNLGYKGDLVNVKRGHFVNFLYPNSLADFATETRITRTSAERKERVLRAEELRKKAQSISEQLATFVLEIAGKASAKGKLYGSIDEKKIVDALAEKAKIEVLPGNIKMQEHIKQVGDYSIILQLTPEVAVEVAVKVTPIVEE